MATMCSAHSYNICNL